ncbi:MAG: hypothetical protein WKF97_25855 [Chitinophagaceae bacterium]
MKAAIIFITFIFVSAHFVSAQAQKIDSIFFNLYTDSLKKGTHNYINVDGKYSDGRWLPLTSKQIAFTSTAGKFDNNSLFVDPDFREEKITVTAVLKSDTSVSRSVTIYIKKKSDNEKLKTAEEVMKELEQGKTRKRKA